MLTRPLGVSVAVTALLCAAAPAALADDGPSGGLTCGPLVQSCDVHAKDPGQAGSTPSPQPAKPAAKPQHHGGKQKCKIDIQSVPCSRPDLGRFNQSDLCYWQPLDPQPPKNDPLWHDAGAPADWKPGDPGQLYERSCPGSMYGDVKFAATDPTQAGAVDPAQLAQEAVDKMTLLGPKIGITPKPGGKGVVGMPVYLWTGKDAEHYGPNTASASAGAVTVTATAKVHKIVWKMGDGHAVTCTSAGTPYKAAYGKKPSPDCGYRYTQPSSTRPGGKYHVTATSTWTIDWNGGGQTGQITQTRTSAVDITVAEVQVLN